VAKYACAILAGLVAGFVNTLAGNGSAITLPVLMLLGLDANDANGTNRVGVALSSLAGAATFRRRGLLVVDQIAWLIVPTALGGAAGAAAAAQLRPDQMKIAIGVVMLVMLGLVVAKPRRWLHEGVDKPDHRSPSGICVLFAVGAYGGFIQAGVGIMLLAALVLKSGYSLVRANPIKVVIVFTLTIPALIIFIANRQVHFALGLLMASGQVTGAWLAARFAAGHPKANIWIRRLLIVMILAAVVKLFGIDGFVLTFIRI